MSLLARLREKKIGKFATATPKTFATQGEEGGRTVASVATVAVASPRKPIPITPMTAEEEKAIRALLALIEETDPATIADVIERCQGDARARAYFLERAAAELPKPDDDDRRTCDQCANLIARRCHAAKRGEIVASRNYEPIRDLPRRCERYAPGSDDPDRRHGRQRWPGLLVLGVNHGE